MSNFLAIATVTAALRDVIHEAALTAVPGASVTMRRPERMVSDGQDKASVNLYLYQVTPNTEWRNADLPTRDALGKLVQRPMIALNLDYLLSFHGSDLEMEPQRLLGSTLIHLHMYSRLSPPVIENAIGSSSFLASSDLQSQIEQVRFSHMNLNLEELSKLWSVFFQIPYVLSVAYRASAVLIEAQEDVPPIPLVSQPRVSLGTEVPPQ